MKRFLGVILVLGCVLLPSLSFAYEKGDRVLVLYEDSFWYPGTVTKVDGNVLNVTFDDGEMATADSERVNKLDWAAGDKVECRWPGDGKNYPGTFVEVKGESVRVIFDDGDKDNMAIGKCRQSRTSRLVGR